MTPRTSLTLAGAALIVGLLVGYGTGWKVSQPTPGKIDPPAPAVTQQDGSLILERKPDPAARPKQALPKGAKTERVVSVEVMPRTNGSLPPGAESPRPVTVDLTLVRMPDQTRRVIASSPDGEIVGGMDVPVEAPPVARIPKHAVLAGYNPITKDAMVGYTRRVLGPIEVGGMAVWQDKKLGAYALVVVRW